MRTHTLFHNMVMLYYALHNVKGRQSVAEILPAFFALLYTAGYQPGGGAGHLAHHFIHKHGQSNASLLHQDIQNQSGRALAVLVVATGRPDKAHFLLLCPCGLRPTWYYVRAFGRVPAEARCSSRQSH